METIAERMQRHADEMLMEHMGVSAGTSSNEVVGNSVSYKDVQEMINEMPAPPSVIGNVFKMSETQLGKFHKEHGESEAKSTTYGGVKVEFSSYIPDGFIAVGNYTPNGQFEVQKVIKIVGMG